MGVLLLPGSLLGQFTFMARKFGHPGLTWCFLSKSDCPIDPIF